MKKDAGLILVTVLALAHIAPAGAQDKSLASTMDVYVFPTEGQEAAQQSTDEASCYEWAVGNTGSDPFDLSKQEQAAQQAEQREQATAKESRSSRRPRVDSCTRHLSAVRSS